MKSKPMRLTSTSYAVMSLLSLLGEATPYDLKQALERSIENFWPVPHTTFYAEPARLARGGLLSEHQEAGGRRRKLYALTEEGRSALDHWTSSPRPRAASTSRRGRAEDLRRRRPGADPPRATWLAPGQAGRAEGLLGEPERRRALAGRTDKPDLRCHLSQPASASDRALSR